MKLTPLVLTPHLSALNWLLIESFMLLAIFILPFSKSAAHISIVISLVLWFFRKFLWNEKFPSIPPCNLSYTLLLVIIFFSLLRVPAENQFLSVSSFLHWIQNIGTFFICVELFEKPKRISRFVGVFVFSMTLVALNGFYQLAHGADLFGHSIEVPGRFFRMRSSLKAPSILASYLLISVPIVFHFWFREKTWSLKSSLYVVLLGLLGVALIATLSRGSFVALTAAIFLYVFFTQKKWVAPLILLAPCLLLLSKMLRYNFFTSLNLKDITVGERLGYWQAALGMIKEHPFIGQGIRMYNAKFPSFAPPSVAHIHPYAHTHNSYLQIWSEIGLWGLLALVIPFFFFLGREMKNRRINDFSLKHALWVGITAFLIQSFFENNFQLSAFLLLFWPFWGMYVALPSQSSGT